jgi:hypothetical protein
MTEASHQMTSNPLPPGRRRPGSVGVPAGAGGAHRRPGRAGPPGRPAGRGGGPRPRAHPRLPGDPEANAESFFGGWFRTGDRGLLDGGYLRLEGRIKELIIRGGENISPGEVEDALKSHPAVADAACFGIDDDKYGQVVGAAVVLKGEADPAQLRARCRASLADFKVPKVIHVVTRSRAPRPARYSAAVIASRLNGRPAVRFAVLGAGAIGGYVGACLARGGLDVTLIARGAHLAAIALPRDPGAEPGRRLPREPGATDDIAAVSGADVVFLGLKAYSLPPVAAELHRALRPGTAVIAAQNGIPWWYFQGRPGPTAIW